jgi:hypothetical protein
MEPNQRPESIRGFNPSEVRGYLRTPAGAKEVYELNRDGKTLELLAVLFDVSIVTIRNARNRGREASTNANGSAA